MGVLGWIVLGGLAGWIASRLTGEGEGCLVSVILGIVGAVIGGFVFSFLGGVGVTGFNLWSLIVSVVGAVILISIARAIKRGG